MSMKQLAETISKCEEYVIITITVSNDWKLKLR